MNKSTSDYLSECGCLKDEFLDHLAFNEKMAELGQLSAGIVHELNTPLSVIVSAAQMILQERDISEFTKEMVERISMEALRLSQLARGMLNFVRSEDDGIEEADVNQVLREVLAFLKYEAQKRSIAVVEEMDFHIPLVQADTNRLKQIFVNLIMNALQAMDDGGALTLKTSMTAGDSIKIEIADSGPGIASHVVDRIFEPFFTTKGPKEGTGLGLFITRKLVETLGGTITLESEAGKGAAFFITLPPSPATAAESGGE